MILLLVLNLTLLIFIALYKRRRKIKDIRKNISYFSPKDLIRRMEGYTNHTKNDKEILKINMDIKDLELREFKVIQNDINQLKKYTMPSKIFLFSKFSLEFKKIVKRIKEYEKSYLSIRFKLFDMTSDYEIENAILLNLKERLSDTEDKLSNSKIKRISDSAKIISKLSRVKNRLQKVDNIKNEQVKHLSPLFVKELQKIDEILETILFDMSFIEKNLNYLKNEINGKIKTIVDVYKKNKENLKDIDEKVKILVKEIKTLKNKINFEIDELKYKLVKENIDNINEKISELNVLIRSNIDFKIFMEKNKTIPDKLLKFIHTNNGLFVSEIKRHKTENEFERLTSIDNSLKIFEDSITKFEREKMNQFNIMVAEGMSNLLLNIINSYEEYISVVNKNVGDISNINSKTNDLNDEIALMNTGLLQIEQNISGINGNIFDIFETEKNILQEKVFVLRRSFKDNTENIKKETFSAAKKIKDKIDNLSSETKGIEFEFFFLREIIMILNKYRGENDAFDLMVVSLEESYKKEEINNALRKSKEIVEMYGIKE